MFSQKFYLRADAGYAIGILKGTMNTSELDAVVGDPQVISESWN